MHEHHLTQDEIETMSANDAAKYLAASDDSKTAMAAKYRAAKAAKPEVGRSSKLRPLGGMFFILGVGAILYMYASSSYSMYGEPLPLFWMGWAMTAASFGFLAFCIGVIEERLFDIHDALVSQKG